nr:MAG TPA: PcfK-like protein [Caudoviricetes sp.]
MGKIEDAIKKINLQIQMSPNDKYRALIGEYIIDQITTEAAAEQILQAEKTLNRALVEITKKAEKQKMGNCAVIEDSVVYGWAREYFGLTANPQTPAEEPKKGVCVSLEDFL